MPANIELKIKVSSFTGVKKKLKELRIKPVKILNQKDIYYEASKNLLKLRIENEKSELIKYSRNESQRERISNYKILQLEKVNNPEKFFSTLFNYEAVVEKQRTLYMYKNTRIHLDKVQNLGKFIELESVVVSGKKKAISEFNEVILKLGINLKNQIRKSYRDLIKEK